MVCVERKFLLKGISDSIKKKFCVLVLPVRKIQQNKHVLLAENFLNHMEQKNEL
jgi:hypothetical protein